MLTKNKLGLTDSTEFAREEDRINKKKAVNLFDFAILKQLSDGTYKTLAVISF
jgi:protein involved in cell division